MGSKRRAVDIGTERARSIVIDLARELRQAREQHGLSQAVVGRAVGLSRSQVSRIERAEIRCLSIRQIARLLAVVGLELSARAYPAGPPIRDAAHVALLRRLRDVVASSVAWQFEAPIGLSGDQRAWDAVMRVDRARIAVEAETRPQDVQALLRRLTAKKRDDPSVSGVVLLLANSRYNRALVREQSDVLLAHMPVPGGSVLQSLAEGRDPGGNGIILL